VRESVVVAREAANGDRQLVAYLITREGQNPTRRQLRQYTADRMPDHMVPAQFVFMTAFPQTPNKKIDRKALPAPDSDVAESENDFEPPATAVEETLAGLWCRLLCVKLLGRREFPSNPRKLPAGMQACRTIACTTPGQSLLDRRCGRLEVILASATSESGAGNALRSIFLLGRLWKRVMKTNCAGTM